MKEPITVDILICTYERASVVPCLQSVARQVVPDHIKLQVFVADNAEMPHARRMVLDAMPSCHYLHAPHSNISIARNALLDASKADFIAFIDDDEFAPALWIQKLLVNLRQSDAVFGDVRAVYPDDAPDWIVANDFHSTSLANEGRPIRTGHAGNVLIRWAGTAWQNQRFDEQLGQKGGEDTEFFNRICRLGAKFSANQDAFVLEPVAPERLCMTWLIRRRFRSGKSFANLGTLASSILILSAFCKVLISCVSIVFRLFHPAKRQFWSLRSIFHFGVFAQASKNIINTSRRRS